MAQRAETIARGAASRVATTDSVDARMRRLERSIDSLVRMLNSEEVSGEERFRLRQQIDRSVFELATLHSTSPDGRINAGNVFIRRGPDDGFEARWGDGGATVLLSRLGQTGMASGWIGIVVSGAPTEVRIENNEMFMRYLTYPEIASVDPSSPAQRAGIVPGDTLMAYNGRDVRREEISMSKLLKPKATVNVRVRRDGKVKELPVVVAEAPMRIRKRREDEMRVASAPWTMIPPRPMIARVPRTAPPALAPRTYVQRPAIATPLTRVVAPLPPVFDLAPSGIAGAQMATVSESMKRSLDVPSGVLVTMVPLGSPAAESGLEDGDVILRVNQQTVLRLDDVRGAVARAAEDGERAVTLELRRGKERRTVALRW